MVCLLRGGRQGKDRVRKSHLSSDPDSATAALGCSDCPHGEENGAVGWSEVGKGRKVDIEEAKLGE